MAESLHVLENTCEIETHREGERGKGRVIEKTKRGIEKEKKRSWNTMEG